MRKADILLVEDSEEFQYMVRASLRNQFNLTVSSSLSEARKKITSNAFDLVIVDILLPDGSGLEFCHELKADGKTGNVPVIFLTSRSEVTDKVVGFSLGADDYITKPFEPAELFARIDSKLKKIQKLTSDDQVLSYGPFRVNTASYQVLITENGSVERKINLTPNECKILLKLLRNKEQIISREQILDSVWGVGVFVEDRTIDKHISSLRKKLGSTSNFIKTVPQLGYILTLEVEETAT